MLVAEQLGQARQGGPHERVEIRAPGQALTEAPAVTCSPSAQLTVTGYQVHRGEDLLDLDDPVDIGAAQPEDAGHVPVNGDGVDVAAEPLEDRAWRSVRSYTSIIRYES